MKRFWRNEQGNILLITLVSILALMAFAGASIDLGREQMVRLKLQQASDAAALAAGLLPAGATNSDRRRVALRYFNLNFPDSYLGILRPTPSIVIGNTITVGASAVVAMNFISNLGVFNSLTATGSSTVPNRDQVATSYDMILVMDNSNSMAQNDLTDVNGSNFAQVPDTLLTTVKLRGVDACTRFYNSLQVPNSSYYVSTVCATIRTDELSDNPPLNDPVHLGIANALNPPARTRLNALRYAAHNLATQLLTPGTENRVGTIAFSYTELDNPAPQDLTSNLTDVANFIDNMYAFGATNAADGLQAARSMANHFNPKHVHAVVLLSDGQNTTQGILYYDPDTTNSFHTSDRHTPACNGHTYCAGASTSALDNCTALKASGTLVYTVAFGPDAVTGAEAANAQAFLRSCASLDQSGNPNFYKATSASQLNQVFQTIYTAVGNVRIVQ